MGKVILGEGVKGTNRRKEQGETRQLWVALVEGRVVPRRRSEVGPTRGFTLENLKNSRLLDE